MERLLIVDDEPLLRETFSTYLSTKTRLVITASDGLAAKALLEKDKNFNLIMTDVRMPRLDGYGLVNALNSLGYSCPVIVASSSSIDRSKILYSGRVELYSKIRSLADLEKLIDSLLQQR